MRWNHLPLPGGLYDQHPELLDQFAEIFSAKAEHDKEEQARQSNKFDKKNIPS